ncbi:MULTISPECIES: response regulator [unclassified Lentimicrobium]|uniref:response regulator n=1 Tax=unclassified Lentimicrobium TaxID=2677434 RepID=UPI0015537C4F|nr:MULTISPECIES: response regulator [unclassified Lentimicrobium]NPD45975.1 response regulator [Lentimicrobium sp. S6]NPD84258.1 response regulator [Lentimicrobium sp. L6]
MTDSNMNYDWKGKTVLIVEDVNHNYKFIVHAIKGTQVSILWAKNGKEAYEACKTDTQIDLVLMDINMPIMNGYKSIRLIKNLGKNIPIITQTAYAFAGEKEKSFAAGSDDYILKPIRTSELLEVMAKHLK